VNYFLKFKAERKFGFSIFRDQIFLKGPASIIKAKNIKERTGGVSFGVEGIEFNLRLLGEFNIYNALAAICIGLSQEASLGVCKRALERTERIAGRMEIVIEKPFKVIVDYAHTPDSLEKVYQTLTHQLINSSTKRPVMGKIAAKYCNEIILTNEDPYDENPIKIIEEIAAGARAQEKIKKILDRKKAIRTALSLAKPGDTVIITGKGSEPWMCIAGGKKIPWDDRKVVKELISEI